MAELSISTTPSFSHEILAENRKRLAELHARETSDPVGTMPAGAEEVMERCTRDFAFWAATCVKIKHKETGELVPFLLNAPQRRVLAMLEAERTAGRPIRIIMLKARQWGGSTLVQMYMAWIQCARRRMWHSLICAHVGKTAATIRGMYATMLEHYPQEWWQGTAAPKLNRYQGQEVIREIAGRDCRVTIGSSERHDSIRGADYAMAHLSEVAFWQDTAKHSPADFIRAICGAIARTPESLIVLESTANGMGNYFHAEWERSTRGESDKITVFVPWHEIEIYRSPVADPAALWSAMDPYEHALWRHGLTLEQIQWYHLKRREYQNHHEMMAEYPTTPQEAFANTGSGVFSPEAVERLRAGCTAPVAVGEPSSATGEVTGPLSLRSVSFTPDTAGLMKVWEHPRPGGNYVAAVDVGGRSSGADWSVVAIFTRSTHPRLVAQWRGHTDHDLLTWKAAQMATLYNHALLVFESNTLESDRLATLGEAPDQGAYILHELYDAYPNLYRRRQPQGGGALLPGFHTNRATKQMIITRLLAAVRDSRYTERDPAACDELAVYERRPNGSYGARRGYHDDLLMTRAIALHAIAEETAPIPHASLDHDPDLAAFLRR